LHKNSETYPLDILLAVCQYIDMVCIYCGAKTKVTNSRPQKRSNAIWRRRQCEECEAVFTSVEAVDLSASLRLKLSDGLEPYKKEKLMISLYESLKHLGSAHEAAKELSETISLRLIHHLQQSGDVATLSVEELVRQSSEVLGQFDRVAGLHYQARYRHYL
jgi:transcriptional repressor NrdR